MRSIVLAMAMAAASAHAGEEMLRVDVCVEYRGVEFRAAHKARWVASTIYREIGVRLEWHRCHRKLESDAHIRFCDETPNDVAPGVIAYALPYEGKTIEIYYDRAQHGARSFLGEFLGHVMAHEIAHLLQGVARHSESGVLKPGWSIEEKDRMSYRPLSFTSHDADLIRSGILARAAARDAVLTAWNTGK